MRKSISYRILFILIFLTFLFTLNTALSGVTNSQVQLSASLFSDFFINMTTEQVKLTENIGAIEKEMQSYLEGGSNSKDEITKSLEASVGSSSDNIARIGDLSEQFSKKVMNNSLVDAYTPYHSDFNKYQEQVSSLIANIKNNETGEIRSNHQIIVETQATMKKSGDNFKKALNDSIDHEKNLINSRVSRSTAIIWVMAILFFIAAVISFYISWTTIIRPLKIVNQSLGEMVKKLEGGEGDLTA
ncbi:MAG: putative methyl-accepting chemotaxis protein, partial [Herbinix sp.]|nr:putative methyl-accepting chemotaxis protein [Herbinix sp.]